MNDSPSKIRPIVGETQYPPNPSDYVFEVPAQAAYLHQPRLPSGYTPMQHIKLEGMMFQAIAQGRCPWVLMFAVWFMLGIGIFLILIPLMTEILVSASGELGSILNGTFDGDSVSFLLMLGQSLIFPVVISLGVFIIAWRGVLAKMRGKRSSSKTR